MVLRKKQFAVFGLGRFGGSLVKEFHEIGVEVLAVDVDQEKVNDFSQYATQAVQASGIDESILEQLEIQSYDHVFVSFGDNIESSILTTMLLKEIGVKQVWSKASNDYHAKVLKKIGADQVIHPERDMAKRIAHYTISEKIIDFIELSKDYSIVEIVATDKLNQKTLLDLDIRAKYGCNIVGIKNKNEIKIAPLANDIIHKEDILIIIGRNEDINRFEEEGV